MADLAGLKAKIGGGAGEGTRSGSDAYDEIKSVIDGWNQKTKHEMRDLLCGLLIKCADICNVVSIKNYFSAGSQLGIFDFNPLNLSRFSSLMRCVILIIFTGTEVRHCCPVGRHSHRRVLKPGRHGEVTRHADLPLWGTPGSR